MRDFSVSVMLQFPGMTAPLPTQVTLQELHFLDRHAERSFASDGTVLYRLPRPLSCDTWRGSPSSFPAMRH